MRTQEPFAYEAACHESHEISEAARHMKEDIHEVRSLVEGQFKGLLQELILKDLVPLENSLSVLELNAEQLLKDLQCEQYRV
ncbi:MAG: hypothetical protein ACRECH_10665 [Nitrososphaerales archaeon]